MNLSFAPMEGVTAVVFRHVHSSMFPGVDTYYAPFIAPDSTGRFKLSHLSGLLPESNTGIDLVPQILANDPDAFLKVAKQLADLGYKCVNLNAGCPSGTVVSKHKGAGMLADTDSLERFLDRIYSECEIGISVKTRMGMESTEEFYTLAGIYNRYPMSALIVHARDRKGLYKSIPDVRLFAEVYPTLKMPVIYNGDIFSQQDLDAVKVAAPGLDSFMIGRGAAANPALFRVLRGGAPLTRQEMTDYHGRMIEENLASGLSPNYTVMRMKELWYYMISMFPDSRKAFKALNKSVKFEDYMSAASFILSGCEFDPDARFSAPC